MTNLFYIHNKHKWFTYFSRNSCLHNQVHIYIDMNLLHQYILHLHMDWEHNHQDLKLKLSMRKWNSRWEKVQIVLLRMTLCVCLDALMARAVPHALVRASCMYINMKVIACPDVYQTALTRCRPYMIYIHIICLCVEMCTKLHRRGVGHIYTYVQYQAALTRRRTPKHACLHADCTICL